MSLEDEPRDPDEASAETPSGDATPSDAADLSEDDLVAQAFAEAAAEAAAEEAGADEEEEAAAPAAAPAPASTPQPQAVPRAEKRRQEFQAGSDLSDLLAKEQLDIDSELRRRPDVRAAEFQQIGEDGEAGNNSLDMLMDIRLPITVELGRTQMLVRDILDYGPGTVIELDKLAGDPVDVLVNGKIVAQGEVVVVDDHFGVRITILLSPQDRIRSLA